MKPHRLETGTDAQERAARWLTDLEDAGPGKRAECLEWLKASPEHVKEFLLMTAMWKGLGGIDAQRRIDVDGLVAEAAATVVPLQSGEERSAADDKRPRARWRWSMAMDAAAVAVLGIWIPQVLNGVLIYSTAVGEQRSVKLADGSMVHLNTQSRIVVTFGETHRDIRLIQGEALFTAMPDAARPFRVRTGALAIQALGTQFNVYRQADGVTVSVIEGSVRVSAQPQAPVTAGEQIYIADNGGLTRATTPDIDKATAWRERRLIFRGDTLERVAAEVNRYNEAVRIRIEGADTRERRMIGVFAADDPESLIQFLAREGDLQIERRGSEILIRSR